MAFFEVVRKAFEAIGNLYKPIAGRGTGGWFPDPECDAQGAKRDDTSPLQMDGSGNGMIRGPVLTDEGSFRCDFPGISLNNALSGTLTFTAGDKKVTGVATAFAAEVDSTMYIKASLDPESDWRQVAVVLSDTELVLVDPYASSTVQSALSTHFPTITGPGGSISVAASFVQIQSGTTVGSRTAIWRIGDYSPILLHAIVNVSQRIASQEAFVGFVDDVSNPGVVALAIFDGTDDTKLKLRTTSGPGATEVEETTFSLPSGYTSTAGFDIELNVTPQAVTLSIEGITLAKHIRHIPPVYLAMFPTEGIRNTGVPPASSTTLSSDTFYFHNQDRVEVKTAFRGEKLAVMLQEDVHYITSIKNTIGSTAEVVALSYTVPPGKNFYLVGYNITGDSGIFGAPFRIGRNLIPPVPDPPAPGVVDGPVFRSVFLLSRTDMNEDFSGSPRYIGKGGDNIVVTVKPSGITSTNWRTSLDFVLR